jgi:hypothetical protein
MKYRLKDDGYSSFRWIMRGKTRVGRVTKNTDGPFSGIIGRVEAVGDTWNDAMNRVVRDEASWLSRLDNSVGRQLHLCLQLLRTVRVAVSLEDICPSSGGHSMPARMQVSGLSATPH